MRIESIDRAQISVSEARRLAEIGVEAGAEVEVLHVGPVGRDPLAVRIGRMTVALRRAVAGSITVQPL